MGQRKTRARTTAESCVVEVLRNLVPGERVGLPDGDTGIVTEQRGEDVYVLQADRIVGRGPWIFLRWQVEAVQS